MVIAENTSLTRPLRLRLFYREKIALSSENLEGELLENSHSKAPS